ncbi:hypothetical protein ACEWY4_022083 [Coilia grayii]|uniref:G-patch domain-containing protein n=1 Tax=Coilia grayii TaxID=363190 RepID=A0ABD1J506_9TELE
MAMLAEPRRKQKWSVDPRNSAWSKDESKFGQKMLERMGWSKGKGLGKTEQGATEHIKVKVKNNSLGLGTNASNEDNWIAHQDDFNQLLADLNNCHGQNTTNESVQEEKQDSFSLEEKSKSSRKRVHYMKFTKGKDLSSRSETDLACIFGKRSKPSRDQDEATAGGGGERAPNPVKGLALLHPSLAPLLFSPLTSSLPPFIPPHHTPDLSLPLEPFLTAAVISGLRAVARSPGLPLHIHLSYVRVGVAVRPSLPVLNPYTLGTLGEQQTPGLWFSSEPFLDTMAGWGWCQKHNPYPPTSIGPAYPPRFPTLTHSPTHTPTHPPTWFPGPSDLHHNSPSAAFLSLS